MGFISANTIFPPALTTDVPVAINVCGGIITSLPFMSIALNAVSSAEVQEFVAIPYFVPIYFENLFSNSLTYLPIVSISLFLLMSCFYVNQGICSSEDDASLLAAAYSGDIESVESLLNEGVKPDISRKHPWSPLMCAANGGHTQIIDLLIDYGAKVDKKHKFDMSALMCAAAKGHSDVVDLLVEHGAKVDLKAKDGMTALSWAANQGHLDIVKLLVSYGADLNAEHSFPWAAHYGYIEIVKYFLDQGVDIDTKDKTGGATALSHAMQHIDVVDFLIKHGADVNQRRQGGFGATPLIFAIQSGSLDIVELLINNGADVDKKQSGGFKLTPLACAIISGSFDMVKLFIDNGADVNKKVKKATPLLFAREGRLINIIELLIEHGAM